MRVFFSSEYLIDSAPLVENDPQEALHNQAITFDPFLSQYLYLYHRAHTLSASPAVNRLLTLSPPFSSGGPKFLWRLKGKDELFLK